MPPRIADRGDKPRLCSRQNRIENIMGTFAYYTLLCTADHRRGAARSVLILIQKGRGGGLSGAFGGGGGSSAFGAKTGDVLTWATSIIFGIFHGACGRARSWSSTANTPRRWQTPLRLLHAIMAGNEPAKNASPDNNPPPTTSPAITAPPTPSPAFTGIAVRQPNHRPPSPLHSPRAVTPASPTSNRDRS